MGLGGFIEGTISIDSLVGVDINDPTNGQVLIYDASTGNWINSSGGENVGYQTIQGQGSDLPQETILNFISGNVTVTDDPTNMRTNVSISGTVLWEVVTTDTSMSVQTGYITNSASLLTFTLPITANPGDTMRINCNSSGLWTIAQNSGQTIRFGVDTTTTSSGNITSLNVGDSIEIICTVANTNFSVVSSIGYFSIT